MDIVSGVQAGLPNGLYEDLGIYRHRVFVEMLGWELGIPDGYERDQFDRPDTYYVVARDEDQKITGCARLLPTTKPYLLGEVFPELLNGQQPPCTPEVWELSRFAAVDLKDASAATARSQISSPIAVELLRGTIQVASSLGAERMITVSPMGVERLLRHAGFRAHRAGPPTVVDGHPLFACWIEIDQG